MSVDERRIWVAGELRPWHDVNMHVLSQSAQRGSLVFDVMSCHWLAAGPAVFGLTPHVERFLNSARLSGMALPLDLAGISAAIGDTVRANPGAEIVKMSAYHAGVSLDVLPRDPEATIAIAAFSVRDIYPGAGSPGRPSPAALQIADTRKMPPWVMSPQAKLAAGYLYTAVAKAEAREKGFDDVLLLDERGELAESSTQSFLLVESGTLLAPGYDYVLRGVTRRALIDLARDEDIPVREEVLPRDLLERADEALLCGTTINVWPVARIDELRLPAPCPGPVTQRLAQRLDALLAGTDPLCARWIEPL